MPEPSRILLVEDDLVIAFDLSDQIEALGHTVLTARDVPAALAILESGAPALALLDVNLGNGATSAPIAEALAARCIPFVLATGEEGETVPGFPDAPILRKPFGERELHDVLTRLAGA